MRDLLRETADYAADFLESLPERPVFPPVDLEALRVQMDGPVPEASGSSLTSARPRSSVGYRRAGRPG
jgi:hypothetical protein